MKKCKLFGAMFFAVSLFLFSSSAATAASISYSLTDLGAQEANLWQIDYQVSGFDSDAYDNLLISFEYGKFENITLGSVSPGWDVAVNQPDFIYGAEEDGSLDALVENPGGILTASFSVQALFLGTGMPGTQNFELVNSETWEAVDQGTTSPVPVPGAIMLMFTGLAGLAATRRNL